MLTMPVIVPRIGRRRAAGVSNPPSGDAPASLRGASRPARIGVAARIAISGFVATVRYGGHKVIVVVCSKRRKQTFVKCCRRSEAEDDYQDNQGVLD